MGYFNSAIVFSSQPDWEALRSLPVQIGLRGFRHSETPLWLLECWTGTRREQPPEYPFQSGREANIFSECEGDITTDRLHQLGKHNRDTYGSLWLRFALQVSRSQAGELYFFAADDETYDLGASISGGEVRTVALRAGMVNMKIENGSFTITPLVDPDDDWDGVAEIAKVTTHLDEFPFVSIAPPTPFENQLYGNVIAEWPAWAGDPESLFGIGTWNPFLDSERDLTVEFQRHAEKEKREPQVVPKREKPRWKFW